MNARMYVRASVVNLGFLAVGAVFGILVASGGALWDHPGRVYAQEKAAHEPQKDVEEVAPIMTVGSAGIGTLLAGRIATDQLMVQGIDILKLNENLLNLLARKPLVATASELQSVIDRSRAEKTLRMKVPPKPAPAKQPKEGEQK